VIDCVVSMHQVVVGQFSGPLDLLLSLIQDQKMEISEVSLSHVTEQFVRYVEGLEEVEAEELADFLVIATKLLLTKSRHVLSSCEPEDEEGRPLEDQLRIYQLFVEASKEVHTRWVAPFRGYTRVEPPRIPEHIPLPANLTITSWNTAIKKLLDRLKPPKPLPQTKIDKTVSLKETMHRLKKILEIEERARFSDIIGKHASKTERIISFLAILEMVKQREILITQEHVFTDIHIEKISV